MAAWCFSPAAARPVQPPVAALHGPSCSFTASATCFRRGATPLTAAACPASQPGRRDRRSLVVRSDNEADFQARVESEDAELESGLGGSAIKEQIAAIRAQGPPPGMSPEQFEKELRAYEARMRSPEMQAQLAQAQLLAEQSPEVKEQMAQMASVMSNQKLMDRMKELQGPQMMARIRELQGDPDIAPFFEAMASASPAESMAVLQRFMGDPEFLAKLGDKIGDIDMSLPSEAKAAAGPPPGAPPQPEIETLLQAAKYGDLEATEDFIAVGHDVNAVDAEKRTPLHYAVAYRHMGIAEELLKGGADLEATDSKGNTPLHYAAGYGRGEFVARLLEGGASGAVKNDSDHTPFELVDMEKRNPLNQELETYEALKAAAGS